MKIEIINGDEAVFRAAAFGLPDRDSVERSYNRLEEFSRGLSDRARGFLSTARDSITSLYDNTVRETVRKLSNSKRGLYRDDVVQFLGTQEDLATAPMAMRRWLLSNPRLGRLYETQSSHAWGAKPGEFNTDSVEAALRWQAIRNGVATQNEKGEWWTEYVYGGCKVTGEEELSIWAQLDLLATMDVAEAIVDSGIDPFNPLGELL